MKNGKRETEKKGSEIQTWSQERSLVKDESWHTTFSWIRRNSLTYAFFMFSSFFALVAGIYNGLVGSMTPWVWALILSALGTGIGMIFEVFKVRKRQKASASGEASQLPDFGRDIDPSFTLPWTRKDSLENNKSAEDLASKNFVE